MKFEPVLRSDELRPKSQLVYNADEYSFNTLPIPTGGFTSLLLNDLNLELDERGTLLSVWGLCPYTEWHKAQLGSPPQAQSAEIRVLSDAIFRPGVSIRLNSQYWPIRVDLTSGWVQITDGKGSSLTVSPFPGVIMQFDEKGLLSSLWLKPRRLPTLT